jgi:hypothetical protein
VPFAFTVRLADPSSLVHSVIGSYLEGLLAVVLVAFRLGFAAIGLWLRRRLTKILALIVLIPLVIAAMHHAFPNLLAGWYASSDQRGSGIAARWRKWDTFCSRSFCSSLFPSPIRHYELHVKEATGYKVYLKNLQAAQNGAKIKVGATPAQKFIATHLPARNSAYVSSSTAIGPQSVSAIYLTGTSARPAKIDRYIAFSQGQKLSGVVFDIKDVYGFVNYRSAIAEVKATQGRITPPLGDLPPLVAYYKSKKLYTIARVALFQDELQAKKFPDRQIKLAAGGPLLTKGRTVWVDPNKVAVQDYNLAIIREVLQAGVDEIQLDYVRYPAEGDWKIATYNGLTKFEQKPRVITHFLQRIYSLVHAYGAHLSLDVFGVVAWQEPLDIKSTGQNMHILAQATDVISPMLYPSHFGHSFGGVTNPADKPAFFMEMGVQKLREITPNQIIRPWLQAFKWRVTNYSPQYITEQIRGSNKAGGSGYLLWNAGNAYEHYREP